MTQINRQHQKCLLVPIFLQNALLDRGEYLWFSNLLMEKWIVLLTCGMWPVLSAVASMRPTEALASVKFWRILPIIFILHKRIIGIPRIPLATPACLGWPFGLATALVLKPQLLLNVLLVVKIFPFQNFQQLASISVKIWECQNTAAAIFAVGLVKSSHRFPKQVWLY